MTTLERLKMSGWKSIKEAEVTFGGLNIMVGANGTGKSNLISYFGFLNDLTEDQLKQHVGRSGGADGLLHFGLKTTPVLIGDHRFSTGVGQVTYRFQLEPTRSN